MHSSLLPSSRYDAPTIFIDVDQSVSLETHTRQCKSTYSPYPNDPVSGQAQDYQKFKKVSPGPDQWVPGLSFLRLETRLAGFSKM